MKYQDKIERLVELLNEEHCSGCDDFNGCDITFAYSSDFVLWAITLFSYSGASSEEFNKLYKSLPKKFHKYAELERQSMCAEEHAMCSSCNAVMWHHSDLMDNGMMHCMSCDQTVTPVKETIFPLRIGAQ